MSSTKKAKVLSSRLSELRQKLGITKERFARELGFSRIAVLHWESGRSEPPAEVYIKLAKMAADVQLTELALKFWASANVSVSDMKVFAPQLRELRRERTGAAEEGEIALVPPTSKMPAGPSGLLRLPALMIRDKATASYVRMAEDAIGGAFKKGDILVLDESESDLWKLADSWVVFRVQPMAGDSSKFSERLFIGRLTLDARGTSAALVIFAAGNEREIIGFRDGVGARLSVPQHWVMLGRLVSWISSPGQKKDA